MMKTIYKILKKVLISRLMVYTRLMVYKGFWEWNVNVLYIMEKYVLKP